MNRLIILIIYCSIFTSCKPKKNLLRDPINAQASDYEEILFSADTTVSKKKKTDGSTNSFYKKNLIYSNLVKIKHLLFKNKKQNKASLYKENTIQSKPLLSTPDGHTPCDNSFSQNMGSIHRPPSPTASNQDACSGRLSPEPPKVDASNQDACSGRSSPEPIEIDFLNLKNKVYGSKSLNRPQSPNHAQLDFEKTLALSKTIKQRQQSLYIAKLQIPKKQYHEKNNCYVCFRNQLL